MIVMDMRKKRSLMEMRPPMSTRAASGRLLQLRGLPLVVSLIACFVLPCIYAVVALQPNMGNALSVLTLQSLTRTSVRIQAVEEEISGSPPSSSGRKYLPLAVEEEHKENQKSILSTENTNVLEDLKENQRSIVSSEERVSVSKFLLVEQNKSMEDTGEQKENQTSIFSTEHSNVLLSPQVNENKSGEDTKDTEEVRLSVSEQETESEANSTIVSAASAYTELNSTYGEEIQNQNAELVSVPLVYQQMQTENNATDAAEMSAISAVKEDSLEGKQDSNNLLAGKQSSDTNILCDFSSERSDTCSVQGDIRVDGRSSSIIVASATQSNSSAGDTRTWKIRPYTRKWEQVMELIREFTIKTSSNPDENPRCTINHNAPAIIFSTGGFVGNFFHDFNDHLVPLFITSRQYQGDVHFLVTDFSYGWISKYKPILSRLSRHNIVNLDSDEQVHCFPQVHLGLISHKELGINPSKTPKGYSIGDFRELLRSSFSLPRKSVGTISGRKPRLLIMLRKGSRSFMNKKAVVSMGKRMGFKVATGEPEDARNLTRFARVVNSCDVMMGVHGAGLTNMMFLPDGASLIQILPWGALHYACFHDFGAPAPDMGLNYFEYDIKEKESSLIKRYSRDDPVFKDPLSIHKQGFGAIWSVFLKDQMVKLDVRRFKGVLQEALQAIH